MLAAAMLRRSVRLPAPATLRGLPASVTLLQHRTFRHASPVSAPEDPMAGGVVRLPISPRHHHAHTRAHGQRLPAQHNHAGRFWKLGANSAQHH